MISPSGSFKLVLVSKPVDFRICMEGLAAIVMNEFDLDPFNGAIFIFRFKGSDRFKMIVWDETCWAMTYKWFEGSGFVWPCVVPRHTRRPLAV